MTKMLNKITPLLTMFIDDDKMGKDAASVPPEEKDEIVEENGGDREEQIEQVPAPALELAPASTVQEPTYKSFKGRKTPRLGEPLLERMEALLAINNVVSEIHTESVKLSSPRVSLCREGLVTYENSTLTPPHPFPLHTRPLSFLRHFFV